MERIHEDGRQDTWAEWKSDVIALSDDALHRYLEGVEGYTSEQVAEFVNRESAPSPDDWTPTEDARAALTRFFAFKRDVLDKGGPGAALASQERREAALSPNDARGRTREEWEQDVTLIPNGDDAPAGSTARDKDRSGSDYDENVGDESTPEVRESNASNYGAAAVDTPAQEDAEKT